jgi:hypothetical protein
VQSNATAPRIALDQATLPKAPPESPVTLTGQFAPASSGARVIGVIVQVDDRLGFGAAIKETTWSCQVPASVFTAGEHILHATVLDRQGVSSSVTVSITITG